MLPGVTHRSMIRPVAAVVLLVFILAPSVSGCRRTTPASEHGHGGNATLAASAAANTSTVLTVTSGGATATLDLATLPKTTFNGQPAVAAPVVWEAANLGSMTDLVFDFEGDDGYKPTSKPKCPAPLKSADFAKGFVVIATRTLEWEEGAGVARCWSVKLTRRVVATKG